MTDVSQEHIAVAVRMRPMNMREVRLCNSAFYDIDRPGRSMLLEMQSRSQLYSSDRYHRICNSQFHLHLRFYLFSFYLLILDCVFGPESTTETVYQGVGKRIVDSFVKGINGSLF